MTNSMKMSCAAVFAVCGVIVVKSNNGDLSLQNKFAKNGSPREVRDLQLTTFSNGGVRGSNTILSTQYSDVNSIGSAADSNGSTDQTTTVASTGFVDTDKGKVNGGTTASVTGGTNGFSKTGDDSQASSTALSQADLTSVGTFGGGFTPVPQGNSTASGPTGGFGLSSGSASLDADATATYGDDSNSNALTTGLVNTNSVLTATNGEDSAAGSGSGTINGLATAEAYSDDNGDGTSSNEVNTGFANYGVGVIGAPVTVALPGAPAGSPGTTFGSGGVRGSNAILSSQYSATDAADGGGGYGGGTTDQTTTGTSAGAANSSKGAVNGSTTASVAGTTYGYAIVDDDGITATAFSQADLVSGGSFGGGFTPVPQGNSTASGPTGGFGLSSGSASLDADSYVDQGDDANSNSLTTGLVNANSMLTATNGEDSAAGSGSGTITGSALANSSSDDDQIVSSSNEVNTGFANYGVGVIGAPVTVALPGAPAGSPGTTFGSGGVRGGNAILSSQYSATDASGGGGYGEGQTDQTTTGTSAGAANSSKGAVNGSTTASVAGTTYGYAEADDSAAVALSEADLTGAGAFGGGFTAVPEPTITDTTPEQGQPFLPFIVLADPFATTSSTTDPAPGPTGGFGLSSGSAGLYSYATAGGDEAYSNVFTTGLVNVNSVLTATNGEGSAGGAGSGTINGSSGANADTSVDESYSTSINELETSFSNYGVGVFGAALTVGLPSTPVAIPRPGFP